MGPIRWLDNVSWIKASATNSRSEACVVPPCVDGHISARGGASGSVAIPCDRYDALNLAPDSMELPAGHTSMATGAFGPMLVAGGGEVTTWSLDSSRLPPVNSSSNVLDGDDALLVIALEFRWDVPTDSTQPSPLDVRINPRDVLPGVEGEWQPATRGAVGSLASDKGGGFSATLRPAVLNFSMTREYRVKVSSMFVLPVPADESSLPPGPHVAHFNVEGTPGGAVAQLSLVEFRDGPMGVETSVLAGREMVVAGPNSMNLTKQAEDSPEEARGRFVTAAGGIVAKKFELQV